MAITLVVPRRYLTNPPSRPNESGMARPTVIHLRDTDTARRAWMRSGYIMSAKALRADGMIEAAVKLEAKAAALRNEIPEPAGSFDLRPTLDWSASEMRITRK
jgi:hypothetical protein